jgi:histidinol phosphatase-like PHP family hydrolase
MFNRREFLAYGAIAASSIWTGASRDVPDCDGVPCVDYHVHVGNEVSIDQAVEISVRRGIKFGLVQHAGIPGQGYAISDDGGLRAWVRSLEGKPVFKGIEAESVNWVSAFSKSAIAQLDYVQADALGMPDRLGKPMQIWKLDFRPANPQEFMDRYVDFQIQRIVTEPIDIFVVPAFLPESLLPDYDRLWTPKRMRTVIEAAVKANVALEIDCRFRVPHLRFLEMAKSAGTKFAFGSNYQTLQEIGDISYCVEMYKRIGLRRNQFFRPNGAGKRL